MQEEIPFPLEILYDFPIIKHLGKSRQGVFFKEVCMKFLVLYSSRTGNTEKAARAIAGALSADIAPVSKAPADLTAYSAVFLGFWAFRRGADPQAQAMLSQIHRPAALFATAGAYPDSDAAKRYLANAAALLPEDAPYLGGFLCQGRVHSFHTGRRSAHTEQVHPLTPERRARLEEAEHHPDEEDLKKAADFAKAIAARLQEE